MVPVNLNRVWFILHFNSFLHWFGRRKSPAIHSRLQSWRHGGYRYRLRLEESWYRPVILLCLRFPPSLLLISLEVNFCFTLNPNLTQKIIICCSFLGVKCCFSLISPGLRFRVYHLLIILYSLLFKAYFWNNSTCVCVFWIIFDILGVWADVNITEEEAFEILRLAKQSSGSSSCNGSRSLINGNSLELCWGFLLKWFTEGFSFWTF